MHKDEFKNSGLIFQIWNLKQGALTLSGACSIGTISKKLHQVSVSLVQYTESWNLIKAP